MKMNRRMSALLQRAGVSMPFGESLTAKPLVVPALVRVGDFVLAKEQYEANKHISPDDLPDKTGYECLINHVHFLFDGTSESIKSSLGYAVALQWTLAQLGEASSFQLIVAVRDHECTVRFHKTRPNESWIAEDLEGYAEEAVLVL